MTHSHDQHRVPSWFADAEPQGEMKSLPQNSKADVCIIGAGIAGMSCAYELAKAGKSVIVLDDGPVGGGQTGRTTAHLANAFDDRYYHMESVHGEEGARIIAESHGRAIDRIEEIATTEGIECDFRRLDGYLFLGPDDTPDSLERELEAAHRAGLKGVELLSTMQIGGRSFSPCLRFPRQGQFHPLKYVQGLAAAVERMGGQIYTGVHVDKVEGGDEAKATTSQGKQVTASAVIVATNTPINDMLVIHTKQAPYMSYVIAGKVPKGVIPPGLYWDTHDPYHYVRLQPMPTESAVDSEQYELLIVGGEDHKTAQASDYARRYDSLRKWASDHFPGFQSVEFQWSGQVMEPVDGVGYIGRNPNDKPNVYIVTGDSGQGMTHGAISGILLTDLILGRENAWEKLYDPSRKTLSSAGEFAKENLNVAVQYAAWVTSGDTDSVDSIAKGEGAVLRSGLEKHAVYRDEQGQLHRMTAVCPHLQCIVQWNADEKTWDCPCHGSRFDCQGGVIVGPANVNLEPIDENSKSKASS
jgi:glycine/D-amino acid oxidase-like deaminating enzyme/nitrite reductase/ring-hydroxylating ferredoxin subunit